MNNMRWTCNCVLLGMLASAVSGQEFEVVSVKPNKSGSNSSSTHSDQGRVTASNVPLKNIIMMAYGIREYQLDGPPWLAAERYDVAGKSPEALPKDRQKYRDALGAMMQKMLAERFKLTIHRENRTLPVYGLVVGKNGIKVPEVPDGGSHNSSNNDRHYEATCISLATFAEFLDRRLDLPVIDMTGLKGYYSFSFDWIPDPKPGEKTDDMPSGLTMREIIQEKLGLRLEGRKAPVEVVVVDHIERTPTEN